MWESEAWEVENRRRWGDDRKKKRERRCEWAKWENAVPTLTLSDKFIFVIVKTWGWIQREEIEMRPKTLSNGATGSAAHCVLGHVCGCLCLWEESNHSWCFQTQFSPGVCACVCLNISYAWEPRDSLDCIVFLWGSESKSSGSHMRTCLLWFWPSYLKFL